MPKRWGIERIKLRDLLINLEMCRNSEQFRIKDVWNSILADTAFFLRYLLIHIYINSHISSIQNVMKKSKLIIQKKMDWNNLYNIYIYHSFVCVTSQPVFCIITYLFHQILPPVNSQTGCCRKYIEFVHIVDTHCAKDPVLYIYRKGLHSISKVQENKMLTKTLWILDPCNACFQLIFPQTLKFLIQTAKQPVVCLYMWQFNGDLYISFSYIIKFLNTVMHTKTTNQPAPYPSKSS